MRPAILLCFLLVLAGCKRTKQVPEKTGSVTVAMNGRPLEAIAKATRSDNKLHIEFFFPGDYGGTRIVSISHINAVTGEQRMYPNYATDTGGRRIAINKDSCTAGSYVHFGDYSDAHYYLSDSIQGNSISISSYSQTKISGRFQFSLYRADIGSGKPTQNPDSLVFRSGVFDVKIE